MMNNWKFKDPENTVVFATTKVLKDNKPILHVSHDEDDSTWQFHSAEVVQENEVMTVSLKEVVDYDSTVTGLADLPLGWSAERETLKDGWVRKDQHGTIMK
jgi:hypothetical protein